MKVFQYFFISLLIHSISWEVSAQNENTEVERVLSSYKTALESLSTDGLSELFHKDSQVFESGSAEGSFEHYLLHHLAPELKVFRSFKYSDYLISTVVDLPYAFTTESYTFTIVLAKDGRVIERKGIATSVLRKTDSKWKIITIHNSSRVKK